MERALGESAPGAVMYLKRNESSFPNCSEPPPGLGVRQPSGAFWADVSNIKAVEGHRSPGRYRDSGHSFAFAAHTEQCALPHFLYFAMAFSGRVKIAMRIVVSASEAKMNPPFKFT